MYIYDIIELLMNINEADGNGCQVWLHLKILLCISLDFINRTCCCFYLFYSLLPCLYKRTGKASYCTTIGVGIGVGSGGSVNKNVNDLHQSF